VSAGAEGGLPSPKKGTPRAPRTPSKRKGVEVGDGGEDDEEVDGRSAKRVKKVKKDEVKLEVKDEDEDED